MPEIGIRELKARASEIVRAVRDERARYLVTYRGRPVGVLLPIEEAGDEVDRAQSETTDTPWEELEKLGEEIGKGWQSPLTSTALLSETRR